MERESSKECSVSFLWTNESFSLWNCLSRNSTLFLHGGSECLACFEPTKAARFLKTLEVHSVLYDQRKVRFLKKNCCIYKGFMDVFYIFTSAWKKNHKMCIWNSLFYHVLDRFNLRERNDLTCLIIHSKYFPDSDWLKACV